MSKVDRRVERSSRSAIELRNLLRNVYASPDAYIDDMALRSALKSQGALAQYSCEDLSITASSINTLKRVSGEYIEGGFQALDQLRKGALHRIEDYEQRPNNSNKTTRAGLVKRVKELEEQVLILETANYGLLQSLTEAVNDIKSVTNIHSEEARKHRSKEAIKRLVSMTAINPPPFDKLLLESNVVPLSGK